jgi:Mn2+/Fe2+ NRAMP family transporter
MPDTQSSDRQSDTEHDADDPYGLHPDSIKEPPTDLKGRLLFLGPGLVLVGSVVGSGEIILTTTLGSIVGFSMFWFVLLSCWSKTIIQAELGRYTVSSGEPFLHAFNRLPGKVPGFNGKKVSWYIYFWILWIIPDLLVGGGIYGGAGQAITEAFP